MHVFCSLSAAFRIAFWCFVAGLVVGLFLG